MNWLLLQLPTGCEPFVVSSRDLKITLQFIWGEIMEWIRGDYRLTDDVQEMDADTIHGLLLDTYWASTRTLEQVEQAIQNSLCLGLFHGDHQIGIARAVTDYATTSWLCDVVVHPSHRGMGLGKWLMTTLVAHTSLVGTRMILGTKDAQGVYQPLGFETYPYECMIKWD